MYYDFDDPYNGFRLLGRFKDRYNVGNVEGPRNWASFLIEVVEGSGDQTSVFKLEVAGTGSLLRGVDNCQEFLQNICINKTKEVINNDDYQRGAHYFCTVKDIDGNIKCKMLKGSVS